jgi:geranylgeranyl diphosphate/geranylgeranyl-bacteriochlorophyllide a reductase
MPTYDVLVVGAGPAGAWAACRLARGGARVAIVDDSHPREKACGGGVTGRALELIGDCHLFPRQPIDSARFEQADRLAAVPLAPGALVVASRAAFDRALVAAALDAGAELVAERALDVATAQDVVSVSTARRTLHASWVVGADGAAGISRRRLWRPFRRDQLSIATGFFARDVTSSEILVRFTDTPPGYAWTFPRPDHLAIGICAQADVANAAALRDWTRRWIETAGLARPGTRLESYAWPIPSLGPADFERERAAGPRWILVGDAAGLVDPITREGIFFALQSADACAEAILASGDPAKRYDEALRREIYPELSRAAHLKVRFFEPPFIRLLVDALGRPAIAAIMADLVAGRQPYRGLRRRLLRTWELRLAWQFIARDSRRGRERADRAA